jgi:3-oxoacyl-[acyl-carrier protein] reductase
VKQCALITGASRGIGKAISEKLSIDLGLHILINYISNEPAARETLESIQSNGGSAELVQFDVSDSEEVANTMDQWFKSNPEDQITVLVNNAGITRDNLMVFMSEGDFNHVVQTSLNGMFNVSKSVLTHMVRKRYGRIINMASISGLKGMAGQVNYSAAKGGVIAATKALAREVAKRNITVNAVAPGFIESEMTDEVDPELVKNLVPMRRMGTTEEVAQLVKFLASKDASYITGEVINISGGII